MRFSVSVIVALASAVLAAPLSPLPVEARDPSSVYHSYLRDREASPEPDPSSVYHSYLRDRNASPEPDPSSVYHSYLRDRDANPGPNTESPVESVIIRK